MYIASDEKGYGGAGHESHAAPAIAQSRLNCTMACPPVTFLRRGIDVSTLPKPQLKLCLREGQPVRRTRCHTKKYTHQPRRLCNPLCLSMLFYFERCDHFVCFRELCELTVASGRILEFLSHPRKLSRLRSPGRSKVSGSLE